MIYVDPCPSLLPLDLVPWLLPATRHSLASVNGTGRDRPFYLFREVHGPGSNVVSSLIYIYFGRRAPLRAERHGPLSLSLPVKTRGPSSWESRSRVVPENSDHAFPLNFHTRECGEQRRASFSPILRRARLVAGKSLRRFVRELFIRLARPASLSYALSGRHGTYFPFGPAPFRTRLHNTTTRVRFLFATAVPLMFPRGRRKKRGTR